MAELLEGIRVLDFGRFIAGPYAATMLADFGADVIRIERREGSEDRCIGPVVPSGEGGLFLNVNRNKRGITLDPTHAQAAEIITPLVQTADVVVANLPPDVLRRLRLDYDSLRATKTDIILVAPSAFGPDGPYRDRVGFDSVAQAMSGAMDLTGLPDEPIRSTIPWVDYGTALHAAFGAMAALYRRAQTGEGQFVDVSLLATGVAFTAPFLIERKMTDIVRGRQGNVAYYSSPSDSYRTRDGWIMVPTIGGSMFRRWARLMGREEMIDDERFSDDMARAANAGAIREVMAAWCAERTRAAATEQLEAARIPCGPVNELAEVLDDPHVHARGLLEAGNFAGHAVPLSSPAARLSGSPAAVRRGPPQLGEHTDEVLAELGFTAERIAAFREQGVI